MKRTVRLVLPLALLWWVLTDGAPSGVGFGVAAVVVTLVAMRALEPEVSAGSQFAPHDTVRFRWLAVPRFAAFFVWRSLLAAVDVARRTLSPSMPLSPAVLDVETRLPPGATQVLLAATLSLLPGTLAVSLRDSRITLHVLDDGTDIDGDVRLAERRIGTLFGLGAS